MANVLLISDNVWGSPHNAFALIDNGGLFELTFIPDVDTYPSLAAAIAASAPVVQSALSGESKLATVSVDLNDDSVPQALFECPEAVICVITRTTMRNASGALTTASNSFGWNDPDFDDVVTDDSYTDLSSSTKLIEIPPDDGASIGTAGQVFSTLVNTAQGSPLTCDVDVFGYLIPV